MIAKDLINYMIPPLRPDDDIGKAKLWMDELRLSELPVAHEKRFLGIITEDMLFDANLRFSEVGEYFLTGENCKVNDHSHYYDIIKISTQENFRIVAVVDDLEQYLGVISTEDLLDVFAKSSAIEIPGAILKLKLKSVDYSLSEISRIVEVNDAKILSSHVTMSETNPSELFLTLKINVEDISRIVASLGSHGFQVESSFGSFESDLEQRERLDIFMKYLKI